VVDDRALRRAADLALEFLGGLPERSVGERASIDELRAALDVPLEDASLPSLESSSGWRRRSSPGLWRVRGRAISAS
jgi:hypothetical protein